MLSDANETHKHIDNRLKEIVKTAFDTVEIKEIIYVDDFFDRPGLPEEERFDAIGTPLAAAVAAAVEGGEIPNVKEFVTLGSFNRSGWKQVFDALPSERRDELFNTFYDLKMDFEVDDHAIQAVRVLFDERAKLTNFKTYAREEMSNISNAEKKRSTLFLFDLDASYEKLPKNQGETHLKNALQAGCQFTGLFSHELDPETEQAKLRELINKYGLGTRTIPISK